MRTFERISEVVQSSGNVVNVDKKKARPYAKGRRLVDKAHAFYEGYLAEFERPPRIQNNSFWHKYAVFWSGEFERKYGKKRYPSWFHDVGGKTYYMVFDANIGADEQGPEVEMWIQRRIDGKGGPNPPKIKTRAEHQWMSEGMTMEEDLFYTKRKRDEEFDEDSRAAKRR